MRINGIPINSQTIILYKKNAKELMGLREFDKKNEPHMKFFFVVVNIQTHCD